MDAATLTPDQRWRAAHPEHAKAVRRKAQVRWKLRHIYKISEEEYLSMVKRADGKCEICGQPEVGSYALSLDHDHVTGKARGIVCRRCNTMLEHFQKYKAQVEAYLRDRGGAQ